MVSGAAVFRSFVMSQYRSFLFAEAEAGGDRLVLDSRESHHLVRVLRAEAGASVEVLDGRGRRYAGRLERADGKAARIRVEGVERVAPPSPELVLIQAVPKGRAMEASLRMATEIGVGRIFPLFTDHGEVRLRGGRLDAKVGKWNGILIEACKQCGLPFLPRLEAPVGLREWLRGGRSGPGGSESGELRLVAALERETRPLVRCLREAGAVSRIAYAVGPEGDFSGAEYGLLREAGFLPVSLGANVLRAETAVAYGLGVIDHAMRGETSGGPLRSG